MTEKDKDRFLAYFFLAGLTVLGGGILGSILRSSFPLLDPITTNGLGCGVAGATAFYLVEKWFPGVLGKK